MEDPINVDIWIWALDDASEANRLHRLLPSEEIVHSRQFHKPADRIAFIIRRGRMREILASRLDQRPVELQFQYGFGGKPFLHDGPHFNLSHSSQTALLAVSDAGQLGVDIEAIRPLNTDVPEIFTDTEIASLNALPDALRHAALFKMWTCKEALSKALGLGVWHSPETFSIQLGSGEAMVTRMVGDDASAWSLVDLEDYCRIPSTLAIRANGRQLNILRLD